jgi:hypothetical protein
MRLSAKQAAKPFLSAVALLFGSALLVAQASGTNTQPQLPTFQPTAHNLPASANAFVREVIDNQLKQTGEPAYMYRVRKDTPSGTQIKEVVETNEGSVSWLIAVNEQPLNDEQRRKEDEKLESLLKSPEEQAKHRKDQKEDNERTNKMLRTMQDAFIYTYDGIEPGRTGEVVRLSFKPNPNFKAPDRETQVFRGMEGHMLVDNAARHMLKIDATLVQDVNFGWGIFGRLNKGGHFMVAQARIAQDRWDITDMTLDFTGKVLLFKRLRIKEHQVMTNFRPVPQNLSLYQGVQMLRKQATELAQKKQF